MKGSQIIPWVLVLVVAFHALAFYAIAFSVVFYAGVESSTDISIALSSLFTFSSFRSLPSNPVNAVTSYPGCRQYSTQASHHGTTTSFLHFYSNTGNDEAKFDLPVLDRGIQTWGSMSDAGILAMKRGEKIATMAGMKPDSFSVCVDTGAGSHFVNVYPDMPISKLRIIVDNFIRMDGIPPQRTYLTCNGKPLDELKRVSDYPIWKGCTIFVNYSLLAGGDKRSKTSTANPDSPSRGENKRSRSSKAGAKTVRKASKKKNKAGDVARKNIRAKHAVNKGTDIMRTKELIDNVVEIMRSRSPKLHESNLSKKMCKEYDLIVDKLSEASKLIDRSINGATGISRLNRSYALIREAEDIERQAMGQSAIDDPFSRVQNFSAGDTSRTSREKTSSTVEEETTLRRRIYGLRQWKVGKQQIPRPANGTEYTPTEVVDIMDAANEFGKQNRGATKQLQEVKKWLLASEYYPNKISALNHMYRVYRDGQGFPPKTWNKKGRKNIVDLPALAKIMEEQLTKRRAKTWGFKEVEDALIERRRLEAVSKELDPDSIDMSPTEATVHTYYNALAEYGNVKFTKAARAKPRTRAAAETSLRSATSFLHTIAASHFVIGDSPAGTAIPDDASKGVGKLVDLIRSALAEGSGIDAVDDDGSSDVGNEESNEEGADGTDNDEPVSLYKLFKSMIFSTDDTTVFYYDGMNDNSDKGAWRLASREEDGKKYAFHRPSDGASSGRFKGVNVRLTVTMSGHGMMAPIFATVTGLTDKEIPRSVESGRVVIPVPGLCVGGASDAYANQTGYVVLLRNDKGIEKQNFEWYSDNVRIPFVEKIREKEFEISDASELSKEHTAVLWSDGGIPQLAANTDEAKLSENSSKRIIECKHAAAASAIQQPCDLSAVFRVLKGIAKIVSPSDAKSGVRGKVEKELKIAERKYGIKLPDGKKGSLLDFLSCLPELLSRAATEKNVTQGFIDAGMLDEKTKSVPDFYGILNTMKRSRDAWETDLVVDTFPRLYKHQIEHGHTPESLFDELGYPRDIDDDGNEVKRNAGISNECCQRSKCLSHPYQRMLRQAEIRLAREKVLGAYEKERIGRNKLLLLNRQGEDKLHELADRAATSGRRMLARTPLEHLIQLTAPEMKAMVHCRACEKFRLRGLAYKFPKKKERKGTLEDVASAMEKSELGINLNENDDCLMYRLTKLIGNKELMLKEMPERAVETFIVTDDDCAPDPLILSESGESTQPAPSTFLSNSSWVDLVRSNVRGVTFCEEVTEEMKKLADDLLPKVQSRLAKQKKDRLKGSRVNRHDRWSLLWAADNLSRMCAIAVLAGHVKVDISFAKSDSTLLRRPGKACYHATSEGPESNLAGCYLYYDEEEGCFIRSGKVYGEDRGFADRHKEHKEAATSRPVSSIDNGFYSRYPSRDADEQDYSDKAMDGFFENLTLYCGFGFSERSGIDGICSKQNGIFFWNDEVLDSVKAVEFNCGTLKKKQLHMVGYLSELFYDLLISPSSNVSSSFGFEIPLGIFGSADE